MHEVPQPPEEEPGSPTETEVGEIHRPTVDAYSRTWELELLISGAVLFALLQLPGAIDRWYFGTEPHLAGATRELAKNVYYYAKLTCYTLGAAFVIHLAARAYWVGLLGLDTAFPHGVRWERMRYSPITLRVYRERQPSLEALIRKVDRFCSIIFSFAFVVVFVFVYSVLALLVVGAVAVPVSLYLFDGERLGTITQVLVTALLLPVLLFSLVDRLRGDRLEPSRGLGRLVYRSTSAFYAVSLGVTYIPVFNVLLTNVRRSTVYVAFSAVLAAVMGLFVVKDALLPAGAMAVSGYEYLPDRGETSAVDYHHYADLRTGEERPDAHPIIQSQAIRDPFVRLFIPYLTRRHGEAVERECPGVRPLGGSGPRWLGRNPPEPDPAAVRAVLACLAALQPVRLNGEPLDPEYRFYTDPGTGRRGIVAFIPVAGLPAGENRLTVGALADERDERPRPPYEIPFWVDRSPGEEPMSVAPG